MADRHSHILAPGVGLVFFGLLTAWAWPTVAASAGLRRSVLPRQSAALSLEARRQGLLAAEGQLEPLAAPGPSVSPAPSSSAVAAPRKGSLAAPTPPLQLVGADEDVLPLRRPWPTASPTSTPTPSPAPTLAPWSIPRALPLQEWVTRTRSRRLADNAATAFDPAALPGTLLGVNFAGPDLTADELLTGEAWGEDQAPQTTAWAVEVVYTSDRRFDDQVAGELVAEAEAGFRIILRVDYRRKQPVPSAADAEAVEEYAETFLRFYRLTGGRVRFFIMGNEGNVDAPGDDPSRPTECLGGRHGCTPESYVQVYRVVRDRLRRHTNAYLLVGAPSPGTTGDPLRWRDGLAYLTDTLALLHPLEVDGVALHAYGGQDAATASSEGALAKFTSELADQIAAVEEAGLVSTPLFLTEINQFTTPSAEFVIGAYRWIDEHNRVSGQDVVAACWFVYHDETGQWRDYALEGRGEILDAFRQGGALPPGR